MAFEHSDHVERLLQYQPFDAFFSQLFAENVDTRQSDQIATKAHKFTLDVVTKPASQVVVLTGNAGHGKTHLCGQLITSISPKVDDVRKILQENADGIDPVAELPSGKALHIIKDLSEFGPDDAAERLGTALTSPGRVTVVCANEGKLREVISLRKEELAPIQGALDNVLRTGQTSPDGSVWIINLNHQSVAAHEEKSLIRQALRNWVQDKRKWSVCDRCDARPRCPIYENRRLLADETVLGDSRRAAIEALLRTAEQTDHVITIRELLVFVAHTITGGLRCGGVHEKVSHTTKDNWQYEYLFHEAAFGQRLGPREVERLEVFRATRLLDPGTRSLRTVDDRLHADTGDDVGKFPPPSHDAVGTPRSTNQHRAAAAAQRDLYRFLRRRDFFDAAANPEVTAAFSERLGFGHYADFEQLLASDVIEKDMVHIRNLVLSGLEALQGARRPVSSGSFAVVDPAFSSHRGSASVVACQIVTRKVRLLSQTEWWSQETGKDSDLAEAVDWADRRVYVVMPDSDDRAHAIELDCRQFEFVCRAAQGLVSRAFFLADIRRIGAQLAGIAAKVGPADEITVLVNGKPAKLVIDVGEVIVATEG